MGPPRNDPNGELLTLLKAYGCVVGNNCIISNRSLLKLDTSQSSSNHQSRVFSSIMFNSFAFFTTFICAFKNPGLSLSIIMVFTLLGIISLNKLIECFFVKVDDNLLGQSKLII